MTVPVNPDGQTTWCVPADVLQLTGVTVDQPQCYQGCAVIELHTGRTYVEMMSNPDNGQVKIGRRDLEWMRRAAAYQTAWMTGQPDVFTRLDMDALSAGSRPIQLKDRALTLAPLARKALARVSWLRTRSLHVRSPYQDGLGPISPNPASEANDFYEVFTPMSAFWNGG